MKTGYVPDAGDLVWLTFDPQAGREQAGRRPALVLSPRVYNVRSNLAIVCPITHQVKGYPFEVTVPAGHGVGGVILSDHLKSVDWKARRVERLGRCPTETIEEVRARLAPLLGY
ncbi:MAG TPA: endoribonuclease MazF [Bryobacteraceae bacterium]|nr:endoribonuclease MazF [Bryobacteraceae bacterium]